MIVDPRLGWGNARVVSLGDVTNAPELDMRDPIHFQQDADKLVFAAQGEIEQSWGQLSQASHAGASQDQVQKHQLRLQLLGDQLSKLQDDAANLKKTGEMQAWSARAQDVVQQVHAELRAVAQLNQQSITGGSYKGLLLGLGVAAVVAVAGFYVWKRSKRRR